MLSNFISTFICDNILYQIIDDEIEVGVKGEVIQIVKKVFENFISLGNTELDKYDSYYDYFELLIKIEIEKEYDSKRRMALSMVVLSFVNYSIVNGIGDSNKLDLLESQAYAILGR